MSYRRSASTPWIRGSGEPVKRAAVISGLVGVIVLLFWFLVPDPLVQHLDVPLMSAQLPLSLGTDQLGRDLGARLYFGFLRSGSMVLLALISTLVVAIPASILAARSRHANAMLETVGAAIWSIPTIVLGLVIFVGFKGEWIPLKFAVLGLFNWVPIFRVARDLTIQAQGSPYVTFSRAMGMDDQRVYWFHVLPNVLPGLFPIILLNLISLFEAEFVLGFLGLSYRDPSPTLGGLLRQGISYLNLNMIMLPAGLMAVLVAALVLGYDVLTRPR